MIEFITPRIEEEWGYEIISGALRRIVVAAETYMWHQHRKPIIITELMRNQEEQDNIYGETPKYKERPWKSVHQFGRGCDLRVWEYTASQVASLEDFLNQFTYDSKRLHKKTCLVHDVGKGIHFHIQTME